LEKPSYYGFGPKSHEVVNYSDDAFAVRIVDTPRPLPLLPRWASNFVLWGMAAPFYGVLWKKIVDKINHYCDDLL